MKGCRHAKRLMLRESDQELLVDEAFFLEEHVAVCAECRRYRDVESTVVEAIAASVEPIASDLAVQEAVERIQAQLGSAPPAVRSAPRALRWVVPVAAGVAALLGGAAWWYGGSQREEQRAPAVASEDRVLEERTESPATPVAPDAARDPEGVRTELREVLLASASEDTGALLERFDGFASSMEEQWPIIRFVEDLCADGDVTVARSALRVLGRRGDRISVPSMRAALQRADVSTDVVHALAAMGPTGVPGLASALEVTESRMAAVDALATVGGVEAAHVLETAFDARSQEDEAVFLRAFASMGACSLPSVLRLADRGESRRDLLLATLDRMPDAATALVPLLDDSRLSEAVRFAAAERLPSSGALSWLEERILERFSREAALASLARWEGVEPLEALVRIASAGRLEEERIYRGVRELLERDPRRAETLAQEYVSRGSEQARALLELLIASGAPQSGGACAVLTRAALHEDERLWAALAAADLGVAEDAATLAESFLVTERKERRLRAALLLAMYRLEGEPGVRRVLDDPQVLPGWGELTRVLAEAQDRGPAVSLHRVVRALDDVDARSPNPWKST